MYHNLPGLILVDCVKRQMFPAGRTHITAKGALFVRMLKMFLIKRYKYEHVSNSLGYLSLTKRFYSMKENARHLSFPS